jgi:DNA-binding GntR family transcriptional regulator
MKKRENLKEKVYWVIKNRILSFELKPGEKIQESEIAQELGVSRTPVREALNKLEQEGLIKIFSNKGYFVSDVTSKEIEELYEIREVLEILAIRSSARHSRQEDWAHLEQILLKNDKDRNSEKPTGQLFKDSHRFHEEIARISGNRSLQQILNAISEKINRLQWMDIFFIDRAKISRDEHLEILKCLKRGKIEQAVTLTQRHIQHSKKNILHLLNKKKDLLYIQ